MFNVHKCLFEQNQLKLSNNTYLWLCRALVPNKVFFVYFDKNGFMDVISKIVGLKSLLYNFKDQWPELFENFLFHPKKIIKIHKLEQQISIIIIK